MKVLAIGASRNIGYHACKRLLESGATVTFLLRKPEVFDDDDEIKGFVATGHARLIKGNAMSKDDVAQAWKEAARGDDGAPVEYVLFSVGISPSEGGISLTKGITFSTPNTVTQCLLNVFATLPLDDPQPRVITISSNGLTHKSHSALPLALKPIYGWMLQMPHRDKCGAEEVTAHCAGWEWDPRDSPGADILGEKWEARLPGRGEVKGVVVVRPALLSNGECMGDKGPRRCGKPPYRVKAEGDVSGAWTISRKDVAHFMVEGIMKNWSEWEGKRVSIAY
ncbi:hypothetical protein CONPUDRAFT_134666 [Coniophora puteana RWD-64-598 SS2]|uniref:NAD(P)-binding domain-containing protein n=1 Tax=Coniophora puteana (strain RWD-64-598) TaxID=741705 RepID=A0A5M3N041_CONPW|nr:uncharacterized protein CONPUDRAFT_134666 [Coniophora puteana RWD-64-598 SS2]EIW84749.1 hypothetical protein CONPUDRAFT_134666 [Coniophora puteana RWD-64-598 SS2]